MLRRLVIFSTIIVLLAGSLWAQQPPSFLSYVAIGDSLSAGFISGSLTEEGQRSAFPVLLSAQMRTFIFVPTIASPGIPNEIELVSQTFPPVIRFKPGASAGRIFPLLMPTNLAVPGHTAEDALRKRPALPIIPDANILTNLILGVPGLVVPIAPTGSQVELAEFLRPTFVTIWLGSNEILGAASAGNADVVPFERFRTAFTEIINRILATGAKIAVANVPDVPSAARFLSVQDIAGAIGVPPALVQFATGLGPNDLVLADGLGALGQILLGQARGPLAPQFVLTEDEVTKLRAATRQYNDFIDQTAKDKGFPVVDVNSLLRTWRREGVAVGNLRLTALPLGGIFSLDLIHPTKTGQGLIANAFITAINSFYKTPLQPVNVADIASKDKLIFPTKTEPLGEGLTLEDIQVLTAAFSADPQESQFDWFAASYQLSAISSQLPATRN
jgi:lysophospholipase L1-like esterase